MRKIYLFTLLLLSIVSTAVAKDVYREDSIARVRAFEYYYMQALSLKELNEYSSAVDMFLHCVALQPENTSALFELVPIYNTLLNEEKAIATMEQVVKNEPSNAWYRQVLASYYLDNNNIQKAIEVYEELVKENSSNSEFYFFLSMLYEGNNEPGKALAALNEMERIDGRSEALSMKKSHINLLMQNKEGALAELRYIYNDSPDNINILVLIGDTYLRFGDKDSALLMYKKVISAEPDNLMAQYSLSKYYEMESNDSLYTQSMEQLLFNSKFDTESRMQSLLEYINYKEQRDTTGYVYSLFERLIQQPNDLKDILNLYVDYMFEKGEDKECIVPILEKLLTVEPDNRRAYINLLVYLMIDNKLDEVISYSDKAIMYHPEYLAFYTYKGMAYEVSDNPQKAVEIYLLGLERRSDDTSGNAISNLFGLLGGCYREMKQNNKSYEAYDSALIYNSENIIILNNYAYELALDGVNLEKAEEMSLRAIKAEPDNVTYLDTYAWILFCMERYDEAKAYAEKILEYNPDPDSTLYSHIGDIYAKTGNIDHAVEYWKKAQELGDNSKTLLRKIKKRKYIRDEKR